MNSLRGCGPALLAGAIIIAAAPSAEAQLIRTRPFRGIFVVSQDPAQARHRIDFSAFASAGHDETTARAGDIDVPLHPDLRTATTGNLYMTGSYAYAGGRRTFSSGVSASTRYSDAAGRLSPMRVTGNLRYAQPTSRNGSFQASQGLTYSPYYTFSLAPEYITEGFEAVEQDEPLPEFDPDTDLRTTRRATYGYDTNAAYSHKTGRRSRVNLQYGFRYVDAVTGAFDLLSHSGSVRYSHGIGRAVSLYAGYGARFSTYPDAGFEPVVGHDLLAGIGYSRALPFSRRTRVAFAANTSFVAHADSTRFRLGGSASLQHQFSRTWRTGVFYARGNDVLFGFSAPFATFTDSVTVTLGGRLAGPATISASGIYSHGTFSVSALENVVDSGSANVRVNLPILSLLSVYGEGYYAEYRFERRIGLLEDVPTATRRFGARAGVNLSLPVLR